MSKDQTFQLRYLGVIPQPGYHEYGFRIEDKEKNVRQIVLTIDQGLFGESKLMIQEAPDLCYQKLLSDLSNETAEARIHSPVSVTAVDVARYRNLHPNTKSRVRPMKKHHPAPETPTYRP